MSDGTINFPIRTSHPSPPVGNRAKTYTLGGLPYFMLSDGIPRTYSTTLHSSLTLDDGTNPHGTTKSDVGLGNVPNVDATNRANHTGTQLASTISDLSTAIANYLDRTSVQDNSEQVNTTTTLVDRFNDTITPAHTADYMVKVTYTWAYDEGSTDFIAELLVGGAVVRRHVQEPQDTGGADGGAGTNQRYTATLAYKYAATAATNFDVQLRFRSSTNGVEATIRDSVYTVERFLP